MSEKFFCPGDFSDLSPHCYCGASDIRQTEGLDKHPLYTYVGLDMSQISFGSDNHSGVHPALLEAMVAANQGHTPSYEMDDTCQELKKVLRAEFDAIDSYLVYNGTAANVICLQAAVKSYESVACADISHLNVDECGAPEKIVGCKLIPLPSKEGKIPLEELENLVLRKGDQHFSQLKMVSITQPTEYGTLYSLKEIKAIRQYCDRHDLYLHMDGARLPNAAAALDCSFKELTEDVDVLSFGGAKKGLMVGEQVIIRNPKLTEGVKFYRKQSLQLPSKARFFSAPFLRFLDNQLWREIATHENQMAQYLASQLSAVKITQPVQANGVFCILPKEIIKPLKKKFFFYVWNEKTFEVRLMMSFDTQKEHIDSFVDELNTLLKGG